MKDKKLEAETVREEILRSVRELKEISPLLHMIPSYVTAALCADAISAAGGRPLMAQAKEEMEEITGSADGLAVNMGQPSEEKFLSCRLALETAAKKGIPVMFDPVGAGASAYRREMMAELLSIPWSGVLKGNSSEIHTLLTGALAHDGVDSIGEFSHEQEAFRYLSREAARGRNLVIAETGKRDRILWLEDSMGNAPDSMRRLSLLHDSARPVVIVGTGCASGAILGALLAAEGKKAREKEEPRRISGRRMAVLAAAALSLMAFAEECQEEKGYGSHKAGLLDVLGMPEEEKFGVCLKRMLEI